MSARSPRFEVVHTGPRQFHARFVAANGEKVWTTETYTRRRTAHEAILQVSRPCSSTAWETGVLMNPHGAVEVRYVDERTR